MKILVAEDDSTSAIVLRKALEKMGHEVTVMGDGQEAWNLLQADEGNTYRLIISDWMMPDVDGLELTRRVRSAQKQGQPYRYVILLTARGKSEDRQDGLEAGADDFMTKPLDMGDLVSRLEVANRILALQQDVQVRGQQVESLTGRLEKAQTAPLGEILIAQGVITPSLLRQALDLQGKSGQKLGIVLIENGWATEEEITEARAMQYDVPYVHLPEETPDALYVAFVPEDVARKHRILPLSVREDTLRGEILRVAVVNPWNVEGIDAAQALTKRRIEPVLVSETGLTSALDRTYQAANSGFQDILAESTGDEDSRTLSADDFDTSKDEMSDGDTAPVIRLINTLFTDAIRRRASDIHIEPYKKDFEIRYRIDGELHVIRTLPRQFLAAMVSRIKVMAELDIAERRLPQDGRISVRVDGRGIDMRVSTLPNQFGERVVLRVLDRASINRTLDDLAFSEINRKYWDTLIRHPHGIILVTGPTGSGKTTSLYATLNALKSPTVNIMTCEDPIEYELDRISQSNVNERAGLTFARQLRAILRQDPDVVLVGEIRDSETAEVAFKAALTGHLVLSTLHCNEAAGAPTRLVDMGVAPFLIASAIVGVTAQRLVRRLCPDCREAYEPTEAQRELLQAMNDGVPINAPCLYRPKGCPKCEGVGFKGRVGVHEILLFNDRMQALTMQGAETKALRQTALEGGMVPMVRDGLEKAIKGITTVEEVQKRIGGGH